MTIKKYSINTPVLKLTENGQSTSLTQLPFVNEKPDGDYQYWRVIPTGNYGYDCKVGRSYAEMALNYISQSRFVPLMVWIVRDMPRELSGIEVGFLSAMCEKGMRYV